MGGGARSLARKSAASIFGCRARLMCGAKDCGCKFLKKKKEKGKKWRKREMKTRGLFTALTLLTRSGRGGAPGAWSNEERAKNRRGGDKRKSDGGQAAASPAALADLTRTPPPLLRQAVRDTVCLHKVINNLAPADVD